MSATDVGRAGAAEVDDEVGVLVADLRAADEWPFSPDCSMRRPAKSPGGFTNTDPELGCCSGCVARRPIDVRPGDACCSVSSRIRSAPERSSGRASAPRLAAARSGGTPDATRDPSATSSPESGHFDGDEVARMQPGRRAGVHHHQAADGAGNSRAQATPTPRCSFAARESARWGAPAPSVEKDVIALSTSSEAKSCAQPQHPALRRPCRR